MIDAHLLGESVVRLLKDAGAKFKLFTHREALTWDDLDAVQKETGFFGTEMKCMVLDVDGIFVVYITLQGKKVDFGLVKERIGCKKIKLCSGEDLSEYFGAKPGCAYPFGFDARYTIYIDPEIFDEEWLLFSPVVPTKTVQIQGADLRKVFSMLENKVEEMNFNQN